MSKTYRCPVDDVVFSTEENHKEPHHSDGHVECPGPKCREKHGRQVSKPEPAGSGSERYGSSRPDVSGESLD